MSMSRLPASDLVPARSLPRRKDQLCSVCKDIDFDKFLGEQIALLNGLLRKSIPLGSWGNILRRQYCPFCRLVVHCFSESFNARLPRSLDEEISLWNEKSWKLGIEILRWDGLRSSSYSNKYDLKSRSKRGRREHAYRLIVGSESGRSAHIQYLADAESHEEDREFFGRGIQQDRVDLSIINSWLDRCEKWHGNACGKNGVAASRLPRNLRVIDVRLRCVVKVPENCQYVALSYVWGEEEMVATSRMTMPKLIRENIRWTASGFESTPLPDRLPQTLEDSIQLTQRLGYNYLWNDALCIIQNEPYHLKYNHIGNMDAVYSCAALTIVAASGRHANCGLPGTSSPRRYMQYSETVNGIRLAAMLPTFSDLENWDGLAWNTRGWTLQEKLLSKRILFFTDFQLYFKCSEAIWTEDIKMETGRLSKSIQNRPNKYRWVADREPHIVDQFSATISSWILNLDTKDKQPQLGFLPNYAELITQYTKRSLSDPRDTLFAIEGVLRTFGCPLFSGLPQNYFHHALLWRYHLISNSETMAPNIPSWSWASSRSPKFWNKIDLIYTLWKLNRSNLSDLIIDKKIYGYLQPTESMFYCSNGHMEKIKVGSSVHARRIAISNKGICAQVRPILQSTPGLLINAVIVRLRIGEAINETHSHHDQRGFPAWYKIVDSRQRCCGEIQTSHNIAESGRRRKQDLLTLSWGKSLQYASISSEYIPKLEISSTSYVSIGDSQMPITTTSITNQSRDNWIVANVLLVSYSGPIACRVGIGKVVLTAWVKADPRRTALLLL